MLPDDPNQKPGDPEETSPELPAPDFSTRRIEPQDLEPPAEPEKHDFATRKLESEPPADESAATRRIDPDQLFSALEPELPLPAPPAEPTRIIDEPEGNRGVPSFSLPDEPTHVDPPLPPEPPRPSGFTLPPTPEAPAPGGAPQAKKNNTWVWVAGISAVVVLVICCLCLFAFIAMSVIMSNSGAAF